MTQTTLCPQHTAIIMDGNGRWAAARGLPRLAGHWAGIQSLRRVVETAPALGIRTLTLYAFSSDNWKRPAEEVDGLMKLIAVHLRTEAENGVREGVRTIVIGRRDRLPRTVLDEVEHAEAVTRAGTKIRLRLAIDYSARDAILSVAQSTERTAEGFRGALGEDVDLLIRTGGEQRLSDFLLWESAYAELVFTPRMWPDFGAADLTAAVAAFHGRERRFGGILEGGLGESCRRNGTGTVCQLRGDRWLR